MPHNRKRKLNFSFFLFFATSLIIGLSSELAIAETLNNNGFLTPQTNKQTPPEVNEILADLNDVQVRQLLKQELSKNTEEESVNFTEEIPGPGTFLSSMLTSLITISSESKGRFVQVLSGFPKISPDLYKVFLTL